MNITILLNIIKADFPEKKLISYKEIYSLIKKYEPELKESTLRLRLSYLKRKNRIASVFENIYTFNVKEKYEPYINDELVKISNLLNKEYKEMKICLAETRWLNEFSLHQAYKSNIICMVEDFMSKSIFHFLKDKGKDVLYNPNRKEVSLYLSGNESIIVTNLISRSPILYIKKIIIPKLEKLLVDVFIDTNIYFAYQGSEFKYIFENAEKKYNLNFTEMLNYSRRRGKYNEIKKYIIKLFPQYSDYL